MRYLSALTKTLAFGLTRSETCLADLPLDIHVSACSGTYGVTVLVKSRGETTLASATAKFTVTIPSP